MTAAIPVALGAGSREHGLAFLLELRQLRIRIREWATGLDCLSEVTYGVGREERPLEDREPVEKLRIW